MSYHYHDSASIEQQRGMPAVSPEESQALRIGAPEIHALPTRLRASLVAHWAMAPDARDGELAHAALGLCDLIANKSYHTTRTPETAYFFEETLLHSFFDSPHPGSIDRFFAVAREQSEERLGSDGITPMDAASGWPATLLTQDLGGRLALILSRGEKDKALNLIARPFPLAAQASQSLPAPLAISARGLGEITSSLTKPTPIAVCLSRPELLDIGLELIKRPEVARVVSAAFIAPAQAAPARGYRHAAPGEPDDSGDFKFLRQDPAYLARAWPLVRAIFDAFSPEQIGRLSQKWAKALALSSLPEIREWSRQNLSETHFSKVFDSLSDSDALGDFFRSRDPVLWDMAIQSLGGRGLLSKAENTPPFAMMRAASVLDEQDFAVLLGKLDAADRPALSAHLREGCWVIEDRGNKLRKKGDFLAHCVASNRPRHAVVAKAMFSDAPLSMNYAREVMKYCKERDPVNYGPRVAAVWEKLLLDDTLAAAKAKASAKQAPEPAGQAPAPAAPRRASRL